MTNIVVTSNEYLFSVKSIENRVTLLDSPKCKISDMEDGVIGRYLSVPHLNQMSIVIFDCRELSIGAVFQDISVHEVN